MCYSQNKKRAHVLTPFVIFHLSVDHQQTDIYITWDGQDDLPILLYRLCRKKLLGQIWKSNDKITVSYAYFCRRNESENGTKR